MMTDHLIHSNRAVHVPLLLIHHANQYVITDGYVDREGIGEILGVDARDARQRGFLRLLQIHLDHGVPLNLHMSGTLIEAIAWHHPETLVALARLREAGLLEMVGSTFSQNIMPFFSSRYNRRQINEELKLYRRHLGWDLRTVKAFWVPERVWNTKKLAGVLADGRLLNAGYRYILLDDRLVYSAGDRYWDSPRERFDHESRIELDAFRPWTIEDGRGLWVLPICKALRYLIPPSDSESLDRLSAVLEQLRTSGNEQAVAIYGDDLERAAGVGGWERRHIQGYERFIKWLGSHRWIRPLLISHWARRQLRPPMRPIEPGTFYELARLWDAGEDYRGWYDDRNCREHRKYLRSAERTIVNAERRGGDRRLLDLAWIHLFHSAYETAWHNYRDRPPRLEGWAAALTSHARSCLVIAMAAEWMRKRDGAAHAEIADVDCDGDPELVLKNDHLLAVFSPRYGGRLIHLFQFTDRSGCLVIGNVSDDWNLQEELNRYMDCPANHPGALADVGHEHDCYEVTIGRAAGPLVHATMLNVQADSSLQGTEKRVHLAARATHLRVGYVLAATVRCLSTEICFSPDYRRMLRHGREGLAAFNGAEVRGWRNRGVRVWARIDARDSTCWDQPRYAECGHGFNSRVTSSGTTFGIELGVGKPPAARSE